jgi:hypothetical protein
MSAHAIRAPNSRGRPYAVVILAQQPMHEIVDTPLEATTYVDSMRRIIAIRSNPLGPASAIGETQQG